MEKYKELLLELDKLKAVYRKSYLSDQSRNENSAEHSWHLAMAFMALTPILPNELDINHAIKLALTHDICEIGAGDVCAYYATDKKAGDEENYLLDLTTRHPGFGTHVHALWQEYEAQRSLESHWVKVLDKLLPFLLNLASQGRTWKEQNINANMVLSHNAFIRDHAPEIHDWMLVEIESAVQKDWLSES